MVKETKIEKGDVIQTLKNISLKINSGYWNNLEEMFNLIPEDSDKNLLSQKRFWQGRFYKEKYGDLDKALGYFYKTEQNQDDMFFYAAQLHIVGIFVCRSQYDNALEHIDLIKNYENKDFQVFLNMVIADINWFVPNKQEEAIKIWLSITDTAPGDVYWLAQSHLLSRAAIYKIKNGSHQDFKFIWDKINLQYLEYDAGLLKELLLYDEITENILNIYENVDNIKSELQIKKMVSPQGGFGVFDYCNKFAHYTRSSIAKVILGGEEASGTLQLSVADLMNDPTEGKVLHDILGQPDWLTHRFNHRRQQAYATCFSFNHDSLNQFRLYGKESGKEATGVSMVFNLDMFSEDQFSNNIATINPNSANNQNKFQESAVYSKARKLPLYQCIYYDPKSNYYKLASRSEMTFYRQGKIRGDKPSEIKQKWEKYSQNVFEKEIVIMSLFEQLKTNLEPIRMYIDSLNITQNNEKRKIINLINDILLPIQFLVKHAAFLEEDECRMLYITNAGSDVIKEQNGRLYIEYEPSVVEHLDKIYLSDGAKNERAFLERAWQKALDRDGIDKEIDIRDSDNPFRI